MDGPAHDSAGAWSAVASSRQGTIVGNGPTSPSGTERIRYHSREEIDLSGIDPIWQEVETIPVEEEKMDPSDIIRLLEKLSKNYVELKERNKELLKSSIEANPANAIHVLLGDYLARNIALQESNRQLERVIADTYYYEPVKEPERDLNTRIYRSCQFNDSGSCSAHFGSYSTNTTNSLTSNGSENEESQSPSVTLNSMLDERTALQIVSTFSMQIKNGRTMEERMRIGTKENVEVAFRMVELYPRNPNIESAFCGYVSVLATTSLEGCENIVNANCLDYLCGIYNRLWRNKEREKKTITAIAGVFFQSSYHREFSLILQQDKYIDMLMKTFSEPGFDNYDILCAIALANIIKFAGNNWRFCLPKGEVGSKMLEGMNTWILGLIAPLKFDTFKNKLRDVRDTSLAIQQLAVWTIANMTTIEPDKYCQILREENGVEILNAVISNTHCHKEVVRLIKLVLENMKKTELIRGNGTKKVHRNWMKGMLSDSLVKNSSAKH